MSPEELTTCRNLLELLQDENGEVAQYWKMMLEHIDSQARRIEALKAGWIEERARRRHGDDGSLRCDHYGSEECVAALENFCAFDGCPHKKDFMTQAIRQLAAEHPDLFRDLTKMVADSEKEARP